MEVSKMMLLKIQVQ